MAAGRAAGPRPLPAHGDGQPPMIFRRDSDGYLAAIEWRFLPETFADLPAPDLPASDLPAPDLSDPATTASAIVSGEAAKVRSAWTRPRIPLLPGEEPSPMSRALLVADSGSGVGAALPSSAFIFINVDLTVVLPRDPVGDWILLESSTTIGSAGTGLATTRLSDQTGALGRGYQTLLVAPR